MDNPYLEFISKYLVGKIHFRCHEVFSDVNLIPCGLLHQNTVGCILEVAPTKCCPIMFLRKATWSHYTTTVFSSTAQHFRLIWLANRLRLHCYLQLPQLFLSRPAACPEFHPTRGLVRKDSRPVDRYGWINQSINQSNFYSANIVQAIP